MSRFALVLPALVIASSASSQPIDLDANINLHITLASYAGCDDPDFDSIDDGACADLFTGAIGDPVFIWVVISRETGLPDVGGIQFGIEHSGIIDGWSMCTGGSQIPEDGWPASGTGNACVWADGCYFPAGGAAARVGYFTASTGGTGAYRIIEDPRVEQALFTGCDAIPFTVCPGNLGRIDHGSGGVDEPRCGDRCDETTPVHDVSWSHIKSLF